MKRSIISAALLSLTLAAPNAYSGELGCLAGYNFRQAGAELDTTHYRFRNFNPERTLTITSIAIYAFDGSVLYSHSTSGLPPSLNPTLLPHQTTGFELEDIFGKREFPNNYAQAVITWEADRGRGPVVPLDGVATRITRERVPATGAQGDTRARAILGCRELETGR
jgi:hypothetical protein